MKREINNCGAMLCAEFQVAAVANETVSNFTSVSTQEVRTAVQKAPSQRGGTGQLRAERDTDVSQVWGRVAHLVWK